MTEQEFQNKFDKCHAWVNNINHWFAELQGEVHNNMGFWDQCIHSKSNEDFWDLVTVYRQCKREYPDVCNRYYRAEMYIDDIELLLHKHGSDPIQQPGKMSKNKAIFAGLMNFKDILNEITNTKAVKAVNKKRAAKKPTKPQKPRPQLPPNLWDLP